MTVIRAQALENAGRVISDAAAIFSKLTPRESAQRIWTPGGLSLDELTDRITASRAAWEVSDTLALD